MADKRLDHPFTAERLRRLLFETTPVVYWFEADQTVAERAALMATVPEAAQKVAREIMVTDILEYLDYLAGPEYQDKPLLYFMATDDDSTVSEEDWEARQHSYDWRLILYTDEHGILCDFNGWPGDNEHGAGVYFERDTGRSLTLFGNGDASLEAGVDELESVIDEYETYRQTLGKNVEAEHDSDGER